MQAYRMPLDYWVAGMHAGYVMSEAAMVIGMRLMGMAGIWSVPPSENARMVSEKAAAVTHALMTGGMMALQGKPPEKVASAMIRPIRTKTRSNLRRLSRRGPKLH